MEAIADKLSQANTEFINKCGMTSKQWSKWFKSKNPKNPDKVFNNLDEITEWIKKNGYQENTKFELNVLVSEVSE